jgi:ribosome maturation factor RimP
MHSNLVDLLKPSIEALGYEFWGLEFAGARSNKGTLRVYIDHEQGISVDDCEKVSRQVGRILDVEDPIKSEYMLEVSSPGLDRTLFFPHQYAAYCGEILSVKAQLPIDGQRNFKGILQKVVDNKIIITEANKEVSIDFSNIQKAHLVIDWNSERSGT